MKGASFLFWILSLSSLFLQVARPNGLGSRLGKICVCVWGGGGGGDLYLLFTCAPVSVAMSTTQSAFRSFLAYATPSPSTSLPSASVLLISTVFPEYNVWMSSGRVA